LHKKLINLIKTIQTLIKTVVNFGSRPISLKMTMIIEYHYINLRCAINRKEKKDYDNF